MITKKLILVFSTKLDESTDVVVQKIQQQSVDVIRIDTEDYPLLTTLTTRIVSDIGVSSISYNNIEFSLNHVRSVWFRRLRSSEPLLNINPGIFDFCQRNARANLLGVALLQNSKIMSPIDAIWAAENKAFQLQLASQLGFKIPHTVITNKPEEIKTAFKKFKKQMIAKPMYTGYIDDGTCEWAIFTNQVLDKHIDSMPDRDYSPGIYQELIVKDYDIRVTIVGRKIFVVNILSQKNEEAKIDWRKTNDPFLPHETGVIPSELESKLFKLMDCLCLNYAAIDLVKSVSGEYYFLEVNPNGQWLWLDDILNLGITESIVNWHLE